MAKKSKSKETHSKCRTQQSVWDLSFNDFVSWATSRVLFGIAEGQSLRSLMFEILSNAAQNTQFGGAKKQ